MLTTITVTMHPLRAGARNWNRHTAEAMEGKAGRLLNYKRSREWSRDRGYHMVTYYLVDFDNGPHGNLKNGAWMVDGEFTLVEDKTAAEATGMAEACLAAMELSRDEAGRV